MDLATRLNQTLHRLHIMEKAVHGQVNWLLRSGGFYAPATVVLGNDEVTFEGTLGGCEGNLVLLADGEVEAVEAWVVSQAIQMEVSWTFRLGLTVPA